MSLYSRLTERLPEWGFFSSVPAGMIDRRYLEEPTGFLGRVRSFVAIRAIYLALFLPLTVVDLVSSLLLGMSFATRVFFTSDHLQTKRLSQQQKYATQFSRSLFAILGSVFGLISPKLVAFYFTPEKPDVTGVAAGGRYHHDKDATRVQPESIEALQNIIKLAIAEGRKVIPVGAGFSQGKQFLPENASAFVVDLSLLNSVEIHSADKIAIVGAGARWADIQEVADKHKLALKVMQASNVFSVGGSIGTNIHGWDHQSGVLSNTIESIEIVDTAGNLQTLTPDDPLFDRIMGGFGLFGIVVKVRLKLGDNLKLKEVGTLIEPKDYTQYFRDQVLTNDKAKMHLYRLSLDPSHLLESGVAVSYIQQGDESVETEHLSTKESQNGTRFERVMINIARRLDWLRRYYWNGERDRLLRNEEHPIMTTNEVMQPPINALFNPSVSEAEWLQEYYLPEGELHGFLNDLGALLMANNVPLLNASVRFVKQHQGPLSYCDEGDKFAVVLCFNQSLQAKRIIEAKKWLRASQKMAVERGGTYYLPYQHVSSPDDFATAYPRAAEFQQMKKEVDPNHLFCSGFYQKYLAEKPVFINHFKETMADPEKKEHFKGFLNNVLQRIDSDTFYKLLEDIMKYNDSHEEIYQELCQRLPEIMPNTVLDLKHILDSLAAIKTDLGAQARALLPQEMDTIDGLVEVGYPGRFTGGFKQHYKVTGTVAAVYEGQSVTDYIQTGYPHPYDTFAKLDYSKPNLQSLKDNSAEVITCYVGLHHFPVTPVDELDHFLKDVRRVLKPGGHFLLVDHDIDSPVTLTMANMAHMIFNAVNQTPIQEEMSEVRNFQPMSYWLARMAEHGLCVEDAVDETLQIRAGDPSRNRMIGTVKSALPIMNTPVEIEEDIDSSTPVLNAAWRNNTGRSACTSNTGIFADTERAQVSSSTTPNDSHDKTRGLSS